MVRAVGLEPTLLSEPDFESGASTSFTTPAQAVRLARQVARCAGPGNRAGRRRGSGLADDVGVRPPGLYLAGADEDLDALGHEETDGAA